jgi:ElaB/YqjD/DUF883 family membrane-anchored ribosome-binding protein
MARRQSTVAAAGDKIEEFAEDLGRMLGQARSKAEGWLGQRQAIVKNLTQLRDEATKLLSELGHEAVTVARRGRPRATAAARAVVNTIRGAAPVRKRRKMSKAARAKISAAQKKRWAKVKAEKK